MIKNLMDHTIRKEIIRKNKKINHKSFTSSMDYFSKIPYLMKYHKKKLIFLCILGVASWTYNLHKCNFQII